MSIDVGRTLEVAPPRTLSNFDHFALWGSLGVTLTIPAAALFILQPLGTGEFAFTAALVALLVGLVLGSLILGAVAHIGAVTGAPAMVLTRGVFGRRGSYVPTLFNIAQCVGWTAVEILVIGHATQKIVGGSLALWIICAGAISTATAIRPLRFIRVIRKYVLWAVMATTIYLFIAVIAKGVLLHTGKSWSGFWIAVDVAIALPISWTPLAADYSRHSRRGAFWGTFTGYVAGAGTFFILGLLALITVVGEGVSDVYGFSQAILLLPLGVFALLILIVDEVDDAFANVYSTVASLQNFNATLDRKKLAMIVGAIATGSALLFDVVGYESFLFAIGALFVPLCGVMLVDWFFISHGKWDLSENAPTKKHLFFSWIIGFIVYQLINPGFVPLWSDFWKNLQSIIHFAPATWMSASLFAFIVSAFLSFALGSLAQRR